MALKPGCAAREKPEAIEKIITRRTGSFSHHWTFPSDLGEDVKRELAHGSERAQSECAPDAFESAGVPVASSAGAIEKHNRQSKAGFFRESSSC